MDTVRFGIIGIGAMGSKHMLSIFNNEITGASLTAVCDVNPQRLEWAKENCGDAVKCYSDYKELIASGEVDAIIISTPHYLHPVIAIEGLKSGLHVLVEKPAGVYTKAVRDMNEIAAQSGKVFGINLVMRTHPVYQKAREMIQNGELGPLKRAVWINTNWHRTQAYYNSGGWRATWSGEGGGVLMNQCPHNLDLWQWLFGMPSRVRASCYLGKWHNIEVEDDVSIFAEYEDGRTATFIATTGEFPGTDRLEITGDLGKLVIENEKLTFYKLSGSEEYYRFNSKIIPNTFAPSVEVINVETTGEYTKHRGIKQDFTNAIRFGSKLLAPGEEGIHSLQICNAAYLSAWNDGKWVNLPVDEDEFLLELNKKIASSKEKSGTTNTVMTDYV